MKKMNFNKPIERESIDLFYIKKKNRRNMQSDICLSSIPHFLSFLTSGNCMTRPSAMFMILCLDSFILLSKTVCSFRGSQRNFWFVVEQKKKKKTQPPQEPDFVPAFLLSLCGSSKIQRGSSMAIQSSQYQKLPLAFAGFLTQNHQQEAFSLSFFPLLLALSPI